MKNWEKKTLQMKTIFLFFLTQKDELSIGSKKDVWKWENPFVILSVKWNWDTSPGGERERERERERVFVFEWDWESFNFLFQMNFRRT